MKYDILIAGVGGQGTVLSSRLLAAAAIDAGYFVRTSETIGMSQRGGCVVSHVRIDSENESPIIPLGCADLLIGFEPSEAARNLPRVKPAGKCIINTRIIKPVTSSIGSSAYNKSDILDFVQSSLPGTVLIDGYSLSQKAGSVKALNVLLLGAATAAGFLPFERALMEKVIAANVPKKFMDLNIKAFNLGFEYIVK